MDPLQGVEYPGMILSSKTWLSFPALSLNFAYTLFSPSPWFQFESPFFCRRKRFPFGIHKIPTVAEDHFSQILFLSLNKNDNPALFIPGNFSSLLMESFSSAGGFCIQDNICFNGEILPATSRSRA
jgi:hypothetical protein